MKISLLSAFLLMLCCACQPAGPSLKAEAIDNGRQKAGGDFMLVPGKRIGPLYAAHSLENDLVQTFGPQNVKRQDIYLGEGALAPGFVIFGDTRNEVEVYYDSSLVKDRPAFCESVKKVRIGKRQRVSVSAPAWPSWKKSTASRLLFWASVGTMGGQSAVGMEEK